VALRRGGLRWLAIQDESLTFLRESPEQSILVHAAHAEHPLVTIPAATLSHRLVGLAGTPDLDPTTPDG
jgi:alpha-glucosidase